MKNIISIVLLVLFSGVFYFFGTLHVERQKMSMPSAVTNDELHLKIKIQDEIITELMEQESHYGEWWRKFKPRTGKWYSIDGVSGNLQVNGRVIEFSNCVEWSELNGRRFLLSDSRDFLFGEFYYMINDAFQDPDEMRIFRYRYGTSNEMKSHMVVRRN